MAKSCIYTVLAPGGNLTTTAQSDIYRYAVVCRKEETWCIGSLHRDMRGAMGKARTVMNGHTRAKVVEAVLTEVDGMPIPGAVERLMQEKVDRLRASADRIFDRATTRAPTEAGVGRMIDDFKAYHRWITEIKTQIKAV